MLVYKRITNSRSKLRYTFKNQASFFTMLRVGGGSPLGARGYAGNKCIVTYSRRTNMLRKNS